MCDAYIGEVYRRYLSKHVFSCIRLLFGAVPGAVPGATKKGYLKCGGAGIHRRFSPAVQPQGRLTAPRAVVQSSSAEAAPLAPVCTVQLDAFAGFGCRGRFFSLDSAGTAQPSKIWETENKTRKIIERNHAT